MSRGVSFTEFKGPSYSGGCVRRFDTLRLRSRRSLSRLVIAAASFRKNEAGVCAFRERHSPRSDGFLNPSDSLVRGDSPTKSPHQRPDSILLLTERAPKFIFTFCLLTCTLGDPVILANAIYLSRRAFLGGFESDPTSRGTENLG